VYRRGWAGLGTVLSAEAAISLLHDKGWLIEVPVGVNVVGRPPEPRYYLNPRATKL
jgi:hypothetical protein